MSDLSQQKRVVIITGASGGIGRSCAVTLSNSFPSSSDPRPLVLVLSGRKKNELIITAEQCRSGTTCEICVGDVSNEEDVEGMFKLVKEKYGRVDVLFNVSRTISDVCPWICQVEKGCS